jgi:homoserine O-succinyltransferase
MPIVAHNGLPSFARLQAEGVKILPPDRALAQDIRELHIGLLNMMPDAALGATERQFFRLVAESNSIAQFYMHPFTLPQLPRSAKAQQHIANYYQTFAQIKQQGLDALIITGANVSGHDLTRQPFWQPLIEVIDWAAKHVTSTLCSCLASHAVLHFRYGQKRVLQAEKTWGVFPHVVVDKKHPLVSGVNTRFDVPHSRWNKVSRRQFDAAGLRVLVHSQQVGVHLATSADGLRFVFFQGHPEYDTISLLKEFKREVLRYTSDELEAFPPLVKNYFDQASVALIHEYAQRLQMAKQAGRELPEFPENLLQGHIDNTWHDTAEAVMGNWVGLVYQLTNNDRLVPFMQGVDPSNPLKDLI